MTDGISVLRNAIRARNRGPQALLSIAREIEGLGLNSLETFGDGRADLSVAQLKALAKELYDSEYDPESKMLRSTNREASSLGIRPPPIADPTSLSTYVAPRGPGFPFLHVPRPLSPEQPKVAKRSGWLGGFL